MRAERYILPIFPVLILIGAIGLSYCWDAAVIYLTKHGVHFFDVTLNKVIFASALTVLILVQPTISSIKYLSSLGLKDTRTLTKQWINEHIQQGSVIASGPYGVDFPPEQYAMLHIPFLAFESERVAPFYDPRWYENVDLLITSDYDYGRYASELERYKEFLPFYDTIRTRWKLLFEVKPDADKTGPAFWLYSCPDSLRHPAFVSSMFERFGANPESARISNFLKELNNILMKKKEGQKSMQIMEEILKVEVGNVSLRNRLSEMLISEGRYDDALKHLQYSIQFNPNQPKVFAMAGRCLLRLNKLLEAEATLVKALNSDKYLVDAYDDLIELFTITKQNEKLKVALNNYLGIVPKNSSKRVEIEQKLKEVTL
ncbi:MAG: tetratricopeptide repeat protein [Bacteroidetes bacterium]|nr:MAG: tetratricopeptide repeat protein [Bacteroidota bacterium]